MKNRIFSWVLGGLVLSATSAFAVNLDLQVCNHTGAAITILPGSFNDPHKGNFHYGSLENQSITFPLGNGVCDTVSLTHTDGESRAGSFTYNNATVFISYTVDADKGVSACDTNYSCTGNCGVGTGQVDPPDSGAHILEGCGTPHIDLY